MILRKKLGLLTASLFTVAMQDFSALTNLCVVVEELASQSVDLSSTPLLSHIEDSKTGVTTFLWSAEQ